MTQTSNTINMKMQGPIAAAATVFVLLVAYVLYMQGEDEALAAQEVASTTVGGKTEPLPQTVVRLRAEREAALAADREDKKLVEKLKLEKAEIAKMETEEHNQLARLEAELERLKAGKSAPGGNSPGTQDKINRLQGLYEDALKRLEAQKVRTGAVGAIGTVGWHTMALLSTHCVSSFCFQSPHQRKS
jgi:hypothetical protein